MPSNKIAPFGTSGLPVNPSRTAFLLRDCPFSAGLDSFICDKELVCVVSVILVVVFSVSLATLLSFIISSLVVEECVSSLSSVISSSVN